MDYRAASIVFCTMVLIPSVSFADLCYTGGVYDEGSLQGYADTGPNMAAQVFTIAYDFQLNAITNRARRNGGRTDNAYYSLYSTSGGTPNAELKACNTVSIGSSFQWATSTCDGTQFSAGTYALVLKAATNESNNFHSANAASGASWDYVGGSWGPGNNPSLNLAVQLYCTAVTPPDSGPATSTEALFDFWDTTYFGATITFMLTLFLTVFLWRRLV